MELFQCVVLFPGSSAFVMWLNSDYKMYTADYNILRNQIQGHYRSHSHALTLDRHSSLCVNFR